MPGQDVDGSVRRWLVLPNTGVLPHTGGQLTWQLCRFEELLEFLRSFNTPERREGIAELVRRWRRDGQDHPPARVVLSSPFVDGRALRALRGLLGQVSFGDRRRAAVTPLTAQGDPLVPLLFVDIDPTQLSVLHNAFSNLAAVGTNSQDTALAIAVRAFTTTEDETERWAALARRIYALLNLGWDASCALLRERLGAVRHDSAVTAPVEVTLTAPELAAYDTIAERIVSTWHQNDPLEALLYRH